MGHNSRAPYKVPADVARGSDYSFEDTYLEAKCPSLYDLLARQQRDGAQVKTCSLSIFGQDGNLTMCLNWAEQELILFLVVEDIEGCFEALEANLTSAKPNWRKKKSGWKRQS